MYGLSPYTADVSSTKSARLEARITPEQAQLIRHAAEVEGTTQTDFTVSAALGRAREVLADQRLFPLSEAAFVELNAILDAPAQTKAKLSKLLTSPSVFEQ